MPPFVNAPRCTPSLYGGHRYRSTFGVHLATLPFLHQVKGGGGNEMYMYHICYVRYMYIVARCVPYAPFTLGDNSTTSLSKNS